MKWDRKKLIKVYLDFFKDKKHKEIVNASLIPVNDSSVLFTTAGMHPLVPFLLGQQHPLGKRLVNVQRCIRTGDIDEVGDTTHHTFFEMLGNWSLGDYFKEEAIKYSYEFLTRVLKIDKEKLAVTVFGGDSREQQVPKDDEAVNIWKKLGIKESKIAYLKGGVWESKYNWWGPAGQTGPCGPDSEMFLWKGKSKVPARFDPKDENWVEIWNDVFMQYFKNEKGEYVLAEQKNVDTGMGVERTLALLNGLDDNYLTEIWIPIIEKIEGLSGKSYGKFIEETKTIRIVADHIKAAVMILGEKTLPGNKEQGYVLRRLIRRAIRHGKELGIQSEFIKEVAKTVIEMYDEYSNLRANKDFILSELEIEERKFNQTLQSGLKYFEKITGENKEMSGAEAFLLYQSYGFPIEMIKELGRERKIRIDEKGFEKAYDKHQELSRTATEGKFKSGLADNSEATTRLHSATHLLDHALREILGKEVKQKGSNINPERLRFDFSFLRKMTDEEIRKVEEKVNSIIQKNIQVQREEMSVDEAKKEGAIGVFEAKYGAKVSVFTIGPSKEICSGPHVKNTSELGRFKIVKEEGIAAGVRRIKAELIDKTK